ncbi:MAG: hypothetical protein Ct9H300mP1_10280 [Planctomycetaceae bacterium]|nr:MAG: hypothetical protein Ct9H300mP1_10280 [Planctomycetaceae bacterium]
MGGEIRQADVKALADLARHEKSLRQDLGLLALGKMKPPYHDLGDMIQAMLNAYGRKRLMWASDAPFQVVNGHTYKASIDLIKSGLKFREQRRP